MRAHDRELGPGLHNRARIRIRGMFEGFCLKGYDVYAIDINCVENNAGSSRRRLLLPYPLLASRSHDRNLFCGFVHIALTLE
jgi:hypothetical protein